MYHDEGYRYARVHTPSSPVKRVWVKVKPPGDRKCWSMFPLTRVPFGGHILTHSQIGLPIQILFFFANRPWHKKDAVCQETAQAGTSV